MAWLMQTTGHSCKELCTSAASWLVTVMDEATVTAIRK